MSSYVIIPRVRRRRQRPRGQRANTEPRVSSGASKPLNFAERPQHQYIDSLCKRRQAAAQSGLG